MITTCSSNCWAIGSIRRLECRRQGGDYMAGRDATKRTQTPKLQTLIEVCTDFASLGHTASIHQPAEQVFAVEEEDNQEEEMFDVVDRQQWNTRRAAEPPLSPDLQQMFALARRMGYEMRPIARHLDAPRQMPGPPVVSE